MIGFLFRKRIRGVRVAELAAFGCLTALVLGVYFTKAHAGGETAHIDDVEQQITDEQHRVRLLQAELAHLEAPERIERLSQQYLALAPIDAKREAAPGGLMEIARQAAPVSPPAPMMAKPVAIVKLSAPLPPAIHLAAADGAPQ